MCSFMSCRKTDNASTDNVRAILKENLSTEDFDQLDFGTLTQSVSASTHQQMVRVGFNGKNSLHDFVLLNLNAAGQLTNSKIVHIEGSVTQTTTSVKPGFNGRLETSSLKRTDKTSSVIVNGFIRSLHESKISVNGVRMNVECADCTIPEVIVSTSYRQAYDWTTAWLSIWAMFSDWPSNEYIPIDYTGGGGGGGGSAPASVITIDMESPENKEKIEPKKYTDCFGSIPDGSTTLYTVTISTDLPTDGHPEIFYNWSDGSPGHAFVELSKSTPYGGVSQDFGFYPTSSYKLLPLDNNVSLSSKLVDDGGHEYQARYTISVTQAQFQAAINAVNSARDTYNVGLYNCTDFALGVFNAAGGNLAIPRHSIPGFEVDAGSNTPQGLYEKIQSMKMGGTAGTTTTNNKEYAGSSKGPCD